MADENIGNLMRVEGKITEIHKTAGVIDKIYVQDETGTALLFINGYITSTDTSLDKLTVGMTVSGIGIGSRDVDEESADSAIFARLRGDRAGHPRDLRTAHPTPGARGRPQSLPAASTRARRRAAAPAAARRRPARSRPIPDNCPSKAFTDRPTGAGTTRAWTTSSRPAS